MERMSGAALTGKIAWIAYKIFKYSIILAFMATVFTSQQCKDEAKEAAEIMTFNK